MDVKSLEERIEQLEGMEKRLRVLEDIEQIKQMHIHYVDLLMETKWDEIFDLFADDCCGPDGKSLGGRAGIEKMFKEMVAKNHVGKEGDILVHPIISVDGDNAKGSWQIYLMYFHPRTYQSLFWVQGIYECEYRRVEGKWKFSKFNWIQIIAPPGAPPSWPPSQEYIRTFLSNITSTYEKLPASDSAKEEGPLTRIMILCPNTKELVPTGMATDANSYVYSTIGNHTFQCPACKKMHTWSKRDGILE